MSRGDRYSLGVGELGVVMSLPVGMAHELGELPKQRPRVDRAQMIDSHTIGTWTCRSRNDLNVGSHLPMEMHPDDPSGELLTKALCGSSGITSLPPPCRLGRQ
jgi:hypothetical protein